jgi:hypothetical protein
MAVKSGLKFKCTNLTELRDEHSYMKLKIDAQQEYLLLLFLCNIVSLHLTYMFAEPTQDKIMFDPDYLEKNGIQKANQSKMLKEIEEFKEFIKLPKNREKMAKLNTESFIDDATMSINRNTNYFYNMYNLYDETFNNRVILQNLCNFELNLDQYYSIILNFIDKNDVLRQTLEPVINSRISIIKLYHQYIDTNRGERHIDALLPIKISNDIEYMVDYGLYGFFYNFDDKFKSYIMNKKWFDGYDFYWKKHIKHEYTDTLITEETHKNCLKYLIEILDPDNQQIISMTVTKSHSLPAKQIHYYIKKNVLSDIKSVLTGQPPYRNISLLLHSFATWIFNADSVFSDLMPSMRSIFKKNGIETINSDNDDFAELIQKISKQCVFRGSAEKIIITDEFRNMWIGPNTIREELNTDNIKIYQLVQPETSAKNKYLKYKAKYLALKKLYI